jgi:hypothetical protein
MKAIKNIALCLILSLFLSLSFVNLGSAAAKPTMKIEPEYYTGKAGNTIDVNLYIYDAGEYLVDYTEVYAWQAIVAWDNTYLEITAYDVTFGSFMDAPRIGPWGYLIADADEGSSVVNVADGSVFAIPSAWGGKLLIQDDNNSEIAYATVQDGTQLTLSSALTHNYTMAAGGAAYPWPDIQDSVTVGPAGNRITVGTTSYGAPPGVNGSGLLCTMTFSVKASGTTTLDIDHTMFGAQTYITNTLGVYLGDDPSGDGDPGNWQSELFKENGEFILPWDEDLNGDGAIDVFDLCSIAVWFGQYVPPAPPEYDLDSDGYIGIDDLSLLSTAFGTYAN